MHKRMSVFFFSAMTIVALTFFGCTRKERKTPELTNGEFSQETMMLEEEQDPMPPPELEMEQMPALSEVPQTKANPAAISSDGLSKNKEVQAALKNAGFYTGAIDGIIGPQTKRAIEEFQRMKGLKVDGIIGPKTSAELKTYLNQ